MREIWDEERIGYIADFAFLIHRLFRRNVWHWRT